MTSISTDSVSLFLYVSVYSLCGEDNYHCCGWGFRWANDHYNLCLGCAPGTFYPCRQFRNNPPAPCWPCLPGSFNNAQEQTSCQLCPFGYFQANEAATSCNRCPSGQ